MPEPTLTAIPNSAAIAHEYLTFKLSDEEYAVDILKVREIKCWTPVTPIPNTPEHMLGIINLRGDLIPVFDLRHKFRLAARATGPATVIVFVTVNFADHERVLGLVVDAVADVRSITAGTIQPPPEFGRIDLDYIRGMAVLDERMLVILDIERLLAADFNTAFAHAA
jgi:purine-binding chemotaxis protein CheW